MTLESNLQSKEEKRIVEFREHVEDLHHKPGRTMLKLLLIPGYMASLSTNMPSDTRDRRIAKKGLMTLEIGRDLVYASATAYLALF